LVTGVRVDVEIDAAAGMLDGIRQRLDDPRPLLDLMADEIREYEADVFATRGFGRWEALDPEYAKRKGAGRMLVDDGGLLRSLTRHPAPDAVERISGDSVTVASTDVAAIMHKHGRHVPRRDPAPAPPRRYVDKWAQTLLRALVDGERG
jgi:phage gpG-like protein